MKQRGRVSSAALAVVSFPKSSAVQRPSVPSDLSHDEGREWNRIVGSLPADWFPPETLGMLAQLCRHLVAAKNVASLIKATEATIRERARSGLGFETKHYDRLLKMQQRESLAIATLSTKMRISQQSTYDKSKRKPIEGKKPWATGEG